MWGVYSCPRILSESLCMKSRKSFLLSSSSFQYSIIRLLTKASLESVAAAFVNSSSVKSRNISPLPFRSHSSRTLNSRHISEMVRSLGFLLQLVNCVTYDWSIFKRSAKRTFLMSRVLISSSILFPIDRKSVV